MKEYTICFLVTGGITVEAESEEEALRKFDSEEVQEAVADILLWNSVDITDIYEE